MSNIFDIFFEQRSNIGTIANAYLKTLSINTPKNRIVSEIECHPNFPSLFCLSDVFNIYGLKNVTAEFDNIHFFNLPTPFITQIKGLKSDRSYFSIIKKISGSELQYFDPESNKWKIIEKDQFEKRSNLTAFLVDTSEYTNEVDYVNSINEEKKNKLLKYFLLSLYPFIYVVSFFFELKNGFQLMPFLFSVLTFLGSTICLMLWILEFDKNNTVVNEICNSKRNNNINCQAVLNSKASKIFGLSWSVIGLSYFLGLHFIQILNGVSNSKSLFVISWITIFSIPYTAFSIIYQWKVIKQWCVFCLLVQSVLIAEFVIVINSSWYLIEKIKIFENKDLFLFFLPFSTPIIFLIIVYNLLSDVKNYEFEKKSFLRFKRNNNVLTTILQQQNLVTYDPTGIGIYFGNPNAKFKIIKVCSPYCEPCSKAHAELNSIIKNMNNVGVQIVFNIIDIVDDIKLPPVKHFMALYKEGELGKLEKAMNYWYLQSDKQISELEQLFPLNKNKSSIDLEIQSMYNWCHNMDIKFTPTIFIGQFENDSYKYFQYPNSYKISDLKYFFSV